MEAINYLQLEVNYLQLLNICLQMVILIGKVCILKCFSNTCRATLLFYCHLAVLMTVLFLQTSPAVHFYQGQKFELCALLV